MEAAVLQPVDYDTLLDAVEVLMVKHGLVHIEPHHAFTPGLYTRSIVDIPPDTYLLSYVHTTEHQFIMSKGKIVIYDNGMKMVLIQSPFLGKTYPKTRRLAKTIETVTWTSIHATNIYPASDSDEDFDFAVKQVEEEIFANHENIFLIKSLEDIEWPE